MPSAKEITAISHFGAEGVDVAEFRRGYESARLNAEINAMEGK